MYTLIGSTGFVGSTLMDQAQFKHTYNSGNICFFKEQEHDTVICAGIPAHRRFADEHPEEDLENINMLLENLKGASIDRLVLISTIDVCRYIDGSYKGAYGKNRYYAEQVLLDAFKDRITIIRLPGIFGKHLKKNIIYDLLQNKFYGPVNIFDKYQWYDVANLKEDLIELSKITELFPSSITFNLFSEPIIVAELLPLFPEIPSDILFCNRESAIQYDYTFLQNEKRYWQPKEKIFESLKQLIQEWKS